MAGRLAVIEGEWVPYPDNYDRCSLNKPLMIHIPPEGIHISCPVHSKGHHIYGRSVRC